VHPPLQWEPIIVERQFAPWVLRVPSDRTRRITRLSQDQVAALEELWKARPTAGLEDLAAAGVAAAGAEVVQEELVPVALRYQDAQQYQVGGWWVGVGQRW
jgi:regulator of nonsense transcripts 1